MGKKRKRKLTSFEWFMGFVVFLSAGTFVFVATYLLLEHFIQTEKVPSVVLNASEETVEQNEPPSEITPEGVGEEQTGCALIVESRPPQATLLVEKSERGQTPILITVPCDRAVNFTLELEGHETRKKNIYISRKVHRERLHLVAIPLGKLSLTLTANATVFVNNKKHLEAFSGKTFDISLRSGRRYVLRFLNEALGVDLKKKYFIKKDVVISEKITLQPAQENALN